MPGSGLTAFGARVTYRLQLAVMRRRWPTGGPGQSRVLSRGQRLEGLQDAQPEVRKALDQAGRFLGLASLLTVLLAAIAVALAARRYLARHLDTCALLRYFGMTQAQVLRLHLLAFFLPCLQRQQGRCWALPRTSCSSPDWPVCLPFRCLGRGAGAWPGVLVAFVLLFGFVLPPILQLARVPTVRVLRREFGPPAGQTLLAYALGGVLLAALVVLTAGELRLGLFWWPGFS